MASAWDTAASQPEAAPAAVQPAAPTAPTSSGSAWDAAPSQPSAPAAGTSAASAAKGSAWDAVVPVSSTPSTPAIGDANSNTGRIRAMVARIAGEQGVPVDFAMRLAQQESGFNPGVSSPAGAQGVMQLMPETARGLGVRNAFDPEDNIRGGMKFLRRLLDDNKGDQQAAAASYNAGPGRYQQYRDHGVPLPQETTNYVKTITGRNMGQPAQTTGSAWDAAVAPVASAPVPEQSPPTPLASQSSKTVAAPVENLKNAEQSEPQQSSEPQKMYAYKNSFGEMIMWPHDGDVLRKGPGPHGAYQRYYTPLETAGKVIGGALGAVGEGLGETVEGIKTVGKIAATPLQMIGTLVNNHVMSGQVDELVKHPDWQAYVQTQQPERMQQLRDYAGANSKLLPKEKLAEIEPTEPDAKVMSYTAPENPEDQKGSKDYSPLQKVGAQNDVAFIALGGALRGAAKGDSNRGFEDALNQFYTDPVAANEEYGLNAKKQLTYMSQNGSGPAKAYADYFLAHPTQAAAVAFGAEFINPANYVTGAIVGKAGQALSKAAELTSGGRYAKSFFSPLKHIAAEAGNLGKAKTVNILNQQAVAENDAMHSVTSIFDNLSKEEALDVVRRSQMIDASAEVQEANRLNPNARTWMDATPAEAARMRAEGLTHPPVREYNAGQLPDPDGKLQARAVDLRKAITDMTQAQREQPGLLNQTRVKNEDVYFPFAGAYKDPKYEEDMQTFVANIRGGQRSGAADVRKGTGSDPGKHQENQYLDDALNVRDQSGEKLIKDDFHPAESVYRFLARRGKNVAFERGMRNLPETLRRDIKPSDFRTGDGMTLQDVLDHGYVKSAGERVDKGGRIPNPLEQQPDELNIDYYHRLAEHYNNRSVRRPSEIESVRAIKPNDAEFMHLNVPAGYVYSPDVLSSIGSPTLKGSFVSKGLAGFLGDRAGKGSKASSGLFGHHAMFDEGSILADVQKGMAKFNSLHQTALLANPVVHPFGNIATNASAALGENPIGMAKRYTRASVNLLLSTVPQLKTVFGEGSKGGDTVRKILGDGFKDYAQAAEWYDRARKGGATFETGFSGTALGGDSARLRLSKMSDLTARERLDKAATAANDWNNEATFGKLGEEPHAVELFKHFVDKGYEDEVAGMMTRQVLGNYRNVDPNSLPSRLIMFYPWLKGNMAFWARTFLTKPQYFNAWEEAARRNNEGKGDPRLHDYMHARKDFEFYTGDSKNDQSYKPSIATNMLSDLGKIVNPDTSNIADNITAGIDLYKNRLKPNIGMFEPVAETTIKPAADPALPWNYHTAYDKDEQPLQQIRQTAKFLAVKGLPLPLIKPAIEDMSRLGFKPERMRAYLQNMEGIGMFKEEMESDDSLGLRVVRSKYNNAFAKMRNAKDRGERDAGTRKMFDGYNDEEGNKIEGYYAVRDRLIDAALKKGQL